MFLLLQRQLPLPAACGLQVAEAAKLLEVQAKPHKQQWHIATPHCGGCDG